MEFLLSGARALHWYSANRVPNSQSFPLCLQLQHRSMVVSVCPGRTDQLPVFNGVHPDVTAFLLQLLTACAVAALLSRAALSARCSAVQLVLQHIFFCLPYRLEGQEKGLPGLAWNGFGLMFSGLLSCRFLFQIQLRGWNNNNRKKEEKNPNLSGGFLYIGYLKLEWKQKLSIKKRQIQKAAGTEHGWSMIFCWYNESFYWSCFPLICCQGWHQRSLRSSEWKAKESGGGIPLWQRLQNEKNLSTVCCSYIFTAKSSVNIKSRQWAVEKKENSNLKCTFHSILASGFMKWQGNWNTSEDC